MKKENEKERKEKELLKDHIIHDKKQPKSACRAELSTGGIQSIYVYSVIVYIMSL